MPDPPDVVSKEWKKALDMKVDRFIHNDVL